MLPPCGPPVVSLSSVDVFPSLRLEWDFAQILCVSPLSIASDRSVVAWSGHGPVTLIWSADSSVVLCAVWRTTSPLTKKWQATVGEGLVCFVCFGICTSAAGFHHALSAMALTQVHVQRLSPQEKLLSLVALVSLF